MNQNEQWASTSAVTSTTSKASRQVRDNIKQDRHLLKHMKWWLVLKYLILRNSLLSLPIRLTFFRTSVASGLIGHWKKVLQFICWFHDVEGTIKVTPTYSVPVQTPWRSRSAYSPPCNMYCWEWSCRQNFHLIQWYRCDIHGTIL